MNITFMLGYINKNILYMGRNGPRDLALFPTKDLDVLDFSEAGTDLLILPLKHVTL